MIANKVYDIASIVLAYTGNVRIPARKASAVAAKLEVAAGSDLSVEQRRRLERVKTAGDACDDVLKARERVGPGSVRTARTDVVTAWSGLDGALQAQSTLPPEVGPQGKEATLLREALFGEAEPISQLDAAGAWSASKRRCERIDEEGLEPRLVALGHGPFVVNVRRTTQVLGQAIGGIAMGSASEPSGHALLAARAEFRARVAEYARAVAADVIEDDAASVERFLRMMAPIDEVRVTTSTDDDAETDPTEPVVTNPVPSGPFNG